MQHCIFSTASSHMGQFFLQLKFYPLLYPIAGASGCLRITVVWPSVVQGLVSLLLQTGGLNVLTISIASISHTKPRPCLRTVMATHQVGLFPLPLSLHRWQSIKSARLGEVPNNLCCTHWAWPHPEDDPKIQNRDQHFAKTTASRSKRNWHKLGFSRKLHGELAQQARTL